MQLHIQLTTNHPISHIISTGMCIGNTENVGLDWMQSQVDIFSTAIGLVIILPVRILIVLWLISQQDVKYRELLV